MNDIQTIADNADLIVNGYAFTKCDIGYRVLNINNPQKASVVSPDGNTLETTMDDIEAGIVVDYYLKNKQYMED
ncbi:MAG: hypothetical protein J6Z01_03690 [Bacteroidales bacterium]|jgi:hypothetical protein|nr:hypothetical protein [Bacteroidales bacterium]